MKAIMISIKPKWVAKILYGEKTIEIRKTMPKCDFPIDVYIYATKDKENNLLFLDWTDVPYKLEKDCDNDDLFMKNYSANGKVVAKFTLNKVEEISKNIFDEEPSWRYYENEECLEEQACLNNGELQSYLKMKNGFAWHIDNLKIFDKPKELSEFTNGKYIFGKNYKLELYKLTKAPQSWCYVEVK